MDPLRSDMRPAEALSGPERDARIEQLLLAGLDEYFAHRYEHAIDLWSRVLFFDRQHSRARAYIERGRRAQAERQRESEAALHEAIDALRRGDISRARQLVGDALDRGASPDEAHGMLERIERLGLGQSSPSLRRRPALPASSWSTPATPASDSQARHLSALLAPMSLVAAAIGVLGVAIWGVTVPEMATSAGLMSSSAQSPTTVAWTPEPLPVPHASELYLSRARALVARGRLHDALIMLDRIPVGDAMRAEADRLRGQAQTQLLSLVSTGQGRE